MFKKQTGFKFHTVRCQRKRITGGRKGKCFEIAVDQNIDRVRSGNPDFGILQNGLRKCNQSVSGSHSSASVSNLEINCFIFFYRKNLHGGSKFIQFLELNGSVHQNLHVFSFESNRCQMTDHCLMVIGQFCADYIEVRIVNIIKMLCKILRGKFGNTGSTDMRMHSCARASAQSHNGNFSVRITCAGILIIRKIVFLRIFTILRDFPILIHFYYLFPKIKILTVLS